MKVKIRGLVFAGFAAAVFAQSAMAVAPTQPSATQQATDEKTVTSKYYVDGKFNGDVGYVLTQGAERGSVDFKQLDDEGTSIDTTNPNNGTNIVVTGKAVANAISGLDASLNITGDPTLHTDRVAVYEQGHENDPDYITGYKIIVPNARVASSAQNISDGGTSGQTDVQTNLTTAKAVYDFVTGGAGTGFQRKLTSTEKPSLGVYNADGTSVWRQATGGDYVTVDATGTGAITFDVPSNKIATIGADNPSTPEVEVSEITANSDKLTTGKAVYEYVRDYAGDTYQPKVDSEGLKVGIRTGNANDGYNSTWYSIAAGRRNYDGNNQPTHFTTPGYVAFDQYVDSNGVGDVAVDLDRTRILEGNGAGEYITLQNSGEKLATGLAVAEYSVPMNWTERGTAGSFAVANKKLVTDSSGNVVLAEDTTANIPSDMPDECDTATGTHVCALVAYWDADTENNGANAGLKYEWTIMAPTGNNG